MVRTTYSDPIVCRLIERRFMPVWVDADRRPDISERYNLGGWPTTAFLTPTGRLLGGETYVEAGRMAGLLTQVADAFASRRAELLTQLQPARPDTEAVPAVAAQRLAERAGEDVDRVHQAIVLGDAAAAFAEHAEPVRIVDHHRRLVDACDIDDAVELGDVTLGAEHAV